MNLQTRISSDLTQVEAHYTVVVVGSGYGGAIAASRLARAGQSVCVLERGREYRPGDYPDRLSNAQGSLQIDTVNGKLGAADGLFNLHMNEDMFALVGCGLGGTSLINANVGLEIDRRLFDLETWPAAFKTDKTLLDAGYGRARRMLDLNPYPDSYPTLNKLTALEQSAKAMGQPFSRPPIAVNFEDQTNPFGVPQPKCNGCGDCCSGCNVGAKNTTLMNYLPDAHSHGAQIITQARVERIERDGEVWRVHVAPNGDGAPGAATTVTADVVVLGAGALGSTEILLRSRDLGLALSDRLGRSFSGNGDVLAFGYDSYWRTQPGKGEDSPPAPDNLNAVGVGVQKVPIAQYPGPCITGVIDMRNAEDAKQGLVIEEGVIPGAIAMGLAPGFFFAEALAGSFTQFGLDEVKPRLLDAKTMGQAFQSDPGSLTGWAYKGPVARTQTYLVMSVDDAGGRMSLKDDRLRIHWPRAGQEPSVERDNSLIREATAAIKGQFFPNPLWTKPLGQKLITVHPVGGCGMGDDAAKGVVNDRCQVFAGASGEAVHPGLYVCDGSVMPGAVGVNPLLTISAVAERACELLAQDRGWTIDWAVAAKGPLPGPGEEEAPKAASGAAPAPHDLLSGFESSLGGLFASLEARSEHTLRGLLQDLVQHLEGAKIDLAKTAASEIIHHYPDLLSPQFQFTETMHGWVSLREVTHKAAAAHRVADDFATATAWGRAARTTLDFELTIHTDDLMQLITDRLHPARITGVVTCPGLSATPMKVREGAFHLLALDETAVETWRMTYDMVLERAEGPVLFQGHKVLHQRTGSNVWADVTTLFITVREGETGDGKLLAQGILTLDLDDLTQQAASVKLDIHDNWLQDLLARFPRARNAIAEVYLAKFASFFAMTLFQAYGGLLADMNNFPALEMQARPSARPSRIPRLPAAEVTVLDLPGGFRNTLTRYGGGKKGPVLVAPGFGVRASSFAINTVDENLAEALVAAGYDVWLLDTRTSPGSGSPVDKPLPFTIDDVALLDWPAAIAHVRDATGAADVQAIAHCVPSMALLMSLAAGKTSLRSLISSQLTLHPVADWLTYLKTDLNSAGLLEGLSQLGGMFDIAPGGSDVDHEIDAAAWNVPVPEGQACKNPTCRRIFTVYGPSYDHAQLNHWTHSAMSEMFGRVSMKPFEQLQKIMRQGKAVDADGRDSYLTADGARRLAMPITFISGLGNQLFYPETAQRTLDWLSRHNGPDLYRRHLFPDYAHMDLFIGRDAAKDVFPFLVSELDRFN